VLVFEVEHRIVATNRVRSKSTMSMALLGNAMRTPAVREDADARLVVMARRRADSRQSARARPSGTTSCCLTDMQHRHLVFELHHRLPDVVEELDLDDRLAARRHADGAPDDVGFGER
jgi:hypothetical protein